MKSWEKIAKIPTTLIIVQGYFIDFLETTFQEKTNGSKIKLKSQKTGQTGGKRDAGKGCQKEGS